jgi:dipeptidyl aminopeptidase/acylaminoacyl peptidase
MPKAIVFAIVLLLWAAQAVRTAQAASLEVYGRLPDIEEVAISPDGTRLAFVKTEAGNRLVEAYSLADHKLIAAAIVGDRKLRDIEWADEDHLMIFTSTTGAAFALSSGLREWGSLQVLDIKTHRLKVIPGDNPVPHVNMMNVVRGRTMVRHVQGHTLLYVPVITLGHFTEPALEQVDLSGNSQRLVSQGDDTTEGWLVDTGGTVAVEQDYDQRSQRWSIKLRREGRMQEVASGIEAIDPPHILGFGPEADTILLQTLEQGEPVWRLMSLKDGSLTEPMAERKTFTAPIEDARVQRMIGGMHVADDAQYVFFDPGMQYRWDKIVSGFPGEHLRLMSHDNDLLRFVVRVEGATHGYVYELVDMQTRQIQPLGDVYAGGIKPYEVRRVTYAAADGLQIPAYLTLPRDRTARNLPLIVLPHGGPEVRDTAEFDWWSQALADQGYAVLQPNYRGSAVTRKFVRAGYGEWGRKMQTDLSDGVRYLVK